MIFLKCKNLPGVCKPAFVIFLFFLQISLHAQIDEPTFFNRINSIYYALEQTDLNNFSSWITSNVFEKSTEGFYQDEVFPLELIWVKPNDLYFVRRSLPQLQDSSHREEAILAQTDMQKEIRALLIDWSRFYAGRLLASMPADFTLESISDTILLRYKNVDDNESQTEIYFSEQGIVLETRVISKDSMDIIHTYPEYKFTGEYWLCTGWRVQMVKRGEVESGFRIKVRSHRIDKYWLPSQFQMTLQTKDQKDKIFIRDYNFRNSRVNREIQVLNK